MYGNNAYFTGCAENTDQPVATATLLHPNNNPTWLQFNCSTFLVVTTKTINIPSGNLTYSLKIAIYRKFFQ